jgi:zinc transport system substrate-binding protein
MRNLVFLVCLLPFASQAEIKVVTSIQPLYLITKSIMQGVGAPELLIKPTTSVHDFAFRPSQMRLLKQADLVIWIDRNFESGFQQLPDIIGKDTAALELHRALDLKQKDAHIWYSPTLLLKIVDRIQQALGRIDPQNVARYSSNSKRLSQLIETWSQTTRKQLMASKPTYLLDHNFFSHFESDMDIEAIAVLHDSNEQPPSIRELRRIEKLLIRTPVKCLLHNETMPSKLAQNIAQKFSLTIYSIRSGASDFMQSLQHIGSILSKCH